MPVVKPEMKPARPWFSSGPTPEGKVMMSIPKGSNSGKVLRLKGRGGYADGKRGDLLAKLMVTLPEEEDELLVRFAEDWRKNRPYTPGK